MLFMEKGNVTVQPGHTEPASDTRQLSQKVHLFVTHRKTTPEQLFVNPNES